MKTLTIAEVIEEAKNPKETYNLFYVYRIRKQKLILYIGRSVNPYERLLQHMGKGSYILKHLPDSLAWEVDLLTVEDCLPHARTYIHAEIWEKECPGWIMPQDTETLVDFAERQLIRDEGPDLNDTGVGERKHFVETEPPIMSSSSYLDI